jgi:hypothetical protein
MSPSKKLTFERKTFYVGVYILINLSMIPVFLVGSGKIFDASNLSGIVNLVWAIFFM